MKFSIILSLFLLPLLGSCQEKQVYIVYFGEHKGDKSLHEIEEAHCSYLHSVKESEEEARASLLYSYKHSINGFAALLSEGEASKLSELEEVVSVAKSQTKYSLQTTRSWHFLGLELGDGNVNSTNQYIDAGGGDLLRKAGYGKDIIVGLVDTGIWPESESFNDEGMEHIPQSWKGICRTGVAFNASHCNRKIIGTRYYIKGYENAYGKLNDAEDYLSPRDKDGHGTHTASTAAGRLVPGAAALEGFAQGTASGGAPLARLAIYKACWPTPDQERAVGNACFNEDILAAIDDAIADGVHILSLSLAANEPTPYINDSIAMGALHAVKNNIVVASVAGNFGPAPSTIRNSAPWLITVAASSIDRRFSGPLLLGNGKTIMGQTITPYKLNGIHPLVNAEDAVLPHVQKNETSYCLPGSLSPEKVKGKIVMCRRGTGSKFGKSLEARRAGGAGFILGNNPENGDDLALDAYVLPATSVVANDVPEILKYINSTEKPTARFAEPATVLQFKPAPYMAVFTSRGPNEIDPTILKPDITAPGLYILAAWSEAESPTQFSTDHRSVKYNIISGTSMATPHVAGVAALIRAIHRDWSSAAIRSALMTTAWTKNNMGEQITDHSGKTATPFLFGSGHLRPGKAADPGLVYDASYADYLLYLCAFGVKIPDPKFRRPKAPPPAYNLNYPSISVPKLRDTITINRTVTNVGAANSKYSFSAKPPSGISIEATPTTLQFDHVGQTRSFTITITVRDRVLPTDEYAFGWYTWTDKYHEVTSPVAVSLEQRNEVI